MMRWPIGAALLIASAGSVIEQAFGINNFRQHEPHRSQPGSATSLLPSSSHSPPPFTASGGLQLGDAWSQPTPVQIEIVQVDGTITWIKVPYTSVVETTTTTTTTRCETVKAVPCTIFNSSATVKSDLGSTLSIVDIYTVATTAEVVVKRTVTVLHAAAGDAGFSSRWSMAAVDGRHGSLRGQ